MIQIYGKINENYFEAKRIYVEFQEYIHFVEHRMKKHFKE